MFSAHVEKQVRGKIYLLDSCGGHSVCDINLKDHTESSVKSHEEPGGERLETSLLLINKLRLIYFLTSENNFPNLWREYLTACHSQARWLVTLVIIDLCEFILSSINTDIILGISLVPAGY